MVKYYCDKCGKIANPSADLEPDSCHLEYQEPYRRTVHKTGKSDCILETHVANFSGHQDIHLCAKCWINLLKAHIKELVALKKY